MREYVGKTFALSQGSVIVEDVIAEGQSTHRLKVIAGALLSLICFTFELSQVVLLWSFWSGPTPTRLEDML
jgi:hypothetical protein